MRCSGKETCNNHRSMNHSNINQKALSRCCWVKPTWATVRNMGSQLVKKLFDKKFQSRTPCKFAGPCAIGVSDLRLIDLIPSPTSPPQGPPSPKRPPNFECHPFFVALKMTSRWSNVSRYRSRCHLDRYVSPTCPFQNTPGTQIITIL